MEVVELYCYDISQGLAHNLSASMTGTYFSGVWHTGCVVYGREYFFGLGLQVQHPGNSPVPLSKRLPMGKTNKTLSEVQEFIRQASPRFTPQTYHLLNHNCNHFTQTFVSFLLPQAEYPAFVHGDHSNALGSTLGVTFRPILESFLQQAGQGGAAAVGNPIVSAAQCHSPQRPQDAYEYFSTPLDQKPDLLQLSVKVLQRDSQKSEAPQRFSFHENLTLPWLEGYRLETLLGHPKIETLVAVLVCLRHYLYSEEIRHRFTENPANIQVLGAFVREFTRLNLKVSDKSLDRPDVIRVLAGALQNFYASPCQSAWQPPDISDFHDGVIENFLDPFLEGSPQSRIHLVRLARAMTHGGHAATIRKMALEGSSSLFVLANVLIHCEPPAHPDFSTLAVEALLPVIRVSHDLQQFVNDGISQSGLHLNASEDVRQSLDEAMQMSLGS